MNAYSLIKSLHVTSMVVWLSTLLAAPVFAAVAMRNGAQPAVMAAIHQTYRRVATPAMLLTIGLGLFIAQWGGWFVAHWLQVKLLLVFILAGLHGTTSARLRRASIGAPGTEVRFERLAVVTLGILVIIVWLAISKLA